MYDLYDLFYDFMVIPLAVSFDLAATCASTCCTEYQTRGVSCRGIDS